MTEMVACLRPSRYKAFTNAGTGISKMAPMIELTDRTFSRLQEHAEPLVDTIESVINKILDNYEKTKTDGGRNIENNVTCFNPFTPPDLTHTKLINVEIDGKPPLRSETTWNGLLNLFVRKVAMAATNREDLQKNMVVRFVKGLKTDEGYRHLADVDISVQGQDANGAWRAISHAARTLGCSLKVRFVWRDRANVAFPGTTGEFYIPAR
ncbi:T4SS efffector SepA family protein [Komagataeibacter kakiaceti]|uniref:T4SS efffector SepA family protein n=1 Tax=Komagataeibacter kakiaceti TaxID=943261 RepID=UPI0038990B7A